MARKREEWIFIESTCPDSDALFTELSWMFSVQTADKPERWLLPSISHPDPSFRSIFCPDPFQEWFPGLTFTQHPLAVLHKQHRQKSLLRSNLCANSHLLYAPYLKHLYTISSAQGFTFLHLTSCFTLLQLLDTQCWCRFASPSLSVTAPDCMYSLLTLWAEKIRL